jgi:hypothetical protein
MKMMKLLSLLLVVGIAVSCGKYEEGPGFTVLTKQMRLTGVWKIVKYVDANGNSSNSNENTTWELLKGGDMIVKSGLGSVDGTWQLQNDKQDLRIKFGFIDITSEIIRLTNKELWLRDADGDQTRLEKQ